MRDAIADAFRRRRVHSGLGYHFRNSIEEGIEYGSKIGQRAVNLHLRPVQ